MRADETCGASDKCTHDISCSRLLSGSPQAIMNCRPSIACRGRIDNDTIDASIVQFVQSGVQAGGIGGRFPRHVDNF
jgi:hypothetical protein